MKREYFDQISVRVENEPSYDMKLTYYLLTGAVSEEYSDLKVYGVEIVKEVSEKGVGLERKIVGDLFFKKCEAVEFLHKLCRNQVTPMELKYVIQDYIYDKINTLTMNNKQRNIETKAVNYAI